jgi:ankyrin repeat protein
MLSFSNPLVQALIKKDLALFKTLIADGADIHQDDDSALRYASCYCDFDTNVYILSLGADPFVNNHEPLHSALYSNNLSLVKHFINIGSNPFLENDQYPSGSVGIACANNNFEAVQYLCSLGCSISFNSYGAVYSCLKNHQNDIIEYLTSLPQFDSAKCATDILKTACEYNQLSMIDWVYTTLLAKSSAISTLIYNPDFVHELYSTCYQNQSYESLQKIVGLTNINPDYLLYLEATKSYDIKFADNLLNDYSCFWHKNYKQIVLASFSTYKLDLIEKSLTIFSNDFEDNIFKPYFAQIAFCIEQIMNKRKIDKDIGVEDTSERILTVLELVRFNYDVDKDEHPLFHKIALFYKMNHEVAHTSEYVKKPKL